jgi:AmpD protein
VDLVVVHGISLPPGSFRVAAVDALFTNALDPAEHPYFHSIASLRVSAHLLIARQGSITQYVPFRLRAWHAGASSFEGRTRCNDYSIGIELLGCDDVPYTKAQYVALAKVLKVLMTSFPGITETRIVGHCDVAPGRKTDPGPAFDWHRLRTLLQASDPRT